MRGVGALVANGRVEESAGVSGVRSGMRIEGKIRHVEEGVECCVDPRHGEVLAEVATDLVRCVECLWRPCLTTESHVHARPVISALFSGEIEERVEGVEFHLARSSVFVRPGGVAHTTSTGSDPVRMVAVELNDAFLARYPAAGRLSSRPAVFHEPAILTTGAALSAELRRGRGVGSEVSVDALCLTLVSQILRRSERAVLSPKAAWIGELVDYLRAHYQEHVTIEDVARRFDLNPSYLGRAFRREFEMTMGEYLRRLRIRKSADLLASSELSIGEIAEQCAFSDQAHFTRQFKAAMGTTPSAYRRVVKRAAKGQATPGNHNAG